MRQHAGAREGRDSERFGARNRSWRCSRVGPSDETRHTRVAGEHDIESILRVKGGKKKLQCAIFMHSPQGLRVSGPVGELEALTARAKFCRITLPN